MTGISADLQELVRRAGAAQPAVAAIDLDERLRRLAAGRSSLAAAAPRIVDAAVAEVGIPRRFARREVQSALGVLDALPELAEAIRPRSVPARAGSTVLEWCPFGVVLGWHAANSPVWVPTLVAASALAGGNAVLARPSSRTRATTGLVLDALAAHWARGAIVVVHAPGPLAEPLIWADGVHAVVTHAGGATCARQLAGLGAACMAGARMRPYIPEGPGNDALIVLAGADMERAARAIALAGFANGGQLCMAAKRIIVERAAWPVLEPALVAAVGALVVGDADDEATDVAPLPEGRARALARAALAEALDAGGRIVVGRGESGSHITPTVVLLPEGARDVALWREETFAPVRGLMLAEDVTDAIARANDSRYGLGAAVFGPDGGRAGDLRVARVMLDESPLYQDPHVVVGGVGDSGLAGARPKIEQLVYARRTHRGAVA
ncbi:MAG: aldehyde dehydrogenase family protein [Miltoncostaeaceae bacterium]